MAITPNLTPYEIKTLQDVAWLREKADNYHPSSDAHRRLVEMAAALEAELEESEVLADKVEYERLLANLSYYL
jgi:hypothetical protein